MTDKIERTNITAVTFEEYSSQFENPPPGLDKEVEKIIQDLESSPKLIPPNEQDPPNPINFEDNLLSPKEIIQIIVDVFMESSQLRLQAIAQAKPHIELMVKTYTEILSLVTLICSRCKIKIPSNSPRSQDGWLVIENTADVLKYSSRELVTALIYLSSHFENLNSNLEQTLARVKSLENDWNNALEEIQESIDHFIIHGNLPKVTQSKLSPFLINLGNEIKSRYTIIQNDSFPWVILHSQREGVYLKIPSVGEPKKYLLAQAQKVKGLKTCSKWDSAEEAMTVLQELQIAKSLRNTKVKNVNKYRLGKIQISVKN